WPPDATAPFRPRAGCGRGPGRSWPLWSTPASGSPTWWVSPSRRSSAPRWIASTGAARLWLATGSTDLQGAAWAGLDGAIVLSGVSSREQAEAATEPVPVAVADNLHSLVVASGR